MQPWQYLAIGLSVIAALITIYSFTRYLNRSENIMLSREHIKILSRQAARWAIASRNDTNPIIAILHANYAAGYLWALSDICTPALFEEIMGVDYEQLKAEIVTTQDHATVALAQRCPSIAPEPGILAYVAEEGLLKK